MYFVYVGYTFKGAMLHIEYLAHILLVDIQIWITQYYIH